MDWSHSKGLWEHPVQFCLVPKWCGWKILFRNQVTLQLNVPKSPGRPGRPALIPTTLRAGEMCNCTGSNTCGLTRACSPRASDYCKIFINLPYRWPPSRALGLKQIPPRPRSVDSPKDRVLNAIMTPQFWSAVRKMRLWRKATFLAD